MKKHLFALLGAPLVLLAAACSGSHSGGSDEAVERRVDSLLSLMTLDEKIGQLNQLTAFSFDEMARMTEAGQIGSILNLVDPRQVNELQRVAVEKSRLGIPLIMGRDVIHGFKTIYPIPLGQAATFDPELVREGARTAAVEATAAGVRWTFSPMLDVSRDARWGRIAESYGEDPYLASVMGAATVEGYQTDDLTDPTSMAACAKHFVGYGASESGRDYNSTFIPYRQLHNVYLPPFEAAVKAGAQTVMTSFNDNDGVPSTANRELVTDVLRGQWGFDGFVVTDWNSAGEMLAHGNCADSLEVALKSLQAGVNMDMSTRAFLKQLPALVREGKVTEREIDRAVADILRVKFRLGLFENPYIDTTRYASVVYAPEHLASAKRAATESAILLKNADATLPLGPGVKSVAIVGPMADAPRDQLGTWVFDGEGSHTVTPLAAFRELEKRGGPRVIHAPGLGYTRDKSTAQIPAAVAAARAADAVIAFVGEESFLSGEAHSLADISLQGAQTQLLEALAATGKPLVAVIMAGRPLTIEREVGMADAVLYSFHPGTMGGPALTEILTGEAEPGGRVPATFPRMVGQCPIYYGAHPTGRPATGTEPLLADIPEDATQTSLGCTSYFLDAGFGPLFPFGYGLGYTTFEYGEPKLSATEVGPEDAITVTVPLTNTGTRRGTEVVQLYVRDDAASIARPQRELKGFKRVELAPGESADVEFTLPISELAFVGLDRTKAVEPGTHTLYVAHDSQTGTPVKFTVR